MKVKNIRYERLFSFAKFNNERITFEAELDGNESEDKAMGELFFKVANIEEVFQAYRNCLKLLDRYDDYMESELQNIARWERDIADTKVTIEQLSKGKASDRLQAACRRESLEDMQKHLKKAKEGLLGYRKDKATIETQLIELQTKIKNGNFVPNKTVLDLVHDKRLARYF